MVAGGHVAASALAIGLDEVLVSLAPYSTDALRLWALDVECGFADAGTQRELRRVTGGWPVPL